MRRNKRNSIRSYQQPFKLQFFFAYDTIRKLNWLSTMEENLVEHKFVIILNGIQLETAEVIQCSINYKYPLFSKDEQIIVDNITIPPNNTEYLEIPKGGAYIEHVVPWSQKESDVKLFLEENHFIFKNLIKTSK